MDYNVKPMIHRFRQNDMNIVMDVNSGIVHVVDDVTYRVLEFYKGEGREEALSALEKEYGAEELNEVMDDLDELIRAQSLYAPMDKNYEMAIEDKPIVKALCINIAHDCNLRCKYCFAGQGGYGQWRMLMSFDVARRAVDFLIAHSGHREHCELDFFGGEPLMNWHVVQQTVTYVRQQEKKHDKKIKMSLTTNGMLLDKEKVKYLTDNHISLILSLDGRKEMHDSMRPGVNNEGTYDRIMKISSTASSIAMEKNTMSAVLSPGRIWISLLMWKICSIMDFPRFPWNRLSAMIRRIIPSKRRICLG